MTIAVVIKVNDGVVLAADSATTLGAVNVTTGQLEISNIYNNANKIFNLYKGLPIGGMTWGVGNIGPASISTLSKELRRRFTTGVNGHADWQLDPDDYTLRAVAERVREFFYDERYSQYVQQQQTTTGQQTGLLIAGYSANAELPEAYLVTMEGQVCSGPDVPFTGSGAAWWGQPEAISRVVLGISTALPQALLNLQVDAADVPAYVDAIKAELAQNFVADAMPIQDAIDLARWLVDLTIHFVRFCPGDATVGGPIEVAAITQHEGFKWISRKHYYQSDLNP
jgi:20S proteasome alpha/beta subunit